MAHVVQAISWYRDVNAVTQMPGLSGDVLLRDNVRRTSLKALQLSFDSARAAAALVTSGQQPGPAAEGAGNRMEQAAARTASRIANVQARIDELDQKLARAPQRSRALLAAERKELQAELRLAKQVHDSVQQLAAFAGGVASGAGAAGTLASNIDQLERTVPELSRTSQSPPPAQPAAAEKRSSQPESAGLFGLGSDLIANARARSQLTQLIDQTEALIRNIESLRSPLVTEIRTVLRRNSSPEAEESRTAEQFAARERDVDALALRYKRLSSVVLPLREEGILVENGRAQLIEWRDSITSRSSVAAGYLLIRGAVLAIAIVLVLVMSELWRRGTFRYVKDARRRRQFLVLRRVLVTFAIILIAIIGFVSELGSLATYIGFLTAGLALALQNIILSVVAYFFLIGRYGLRIGDRVTISGVTGDVIDIGLVRIFLMELAQPSSDGRATGRVVVFSNSVIFQPAALFKQMPGADYVWHTVTLTLAPDSDFQLAETTLAAAVYSVYAEYREGIEKQHATFERSVEMQVAPPKPYHRLRFSDDGLEFSVSYPVEMRRATDIDRRVMKALYDAASAEPRLSLARAGAPKLQETR